jgi:hypothetical protein
MNTILEEAVQVIFDKPRTLHDLANEQKDFLATLTTPLGDVDLPYEDNVLCIGLVGDFAALPPLTRTIVSAGPAPETEKEFQHPYTRSRQ